MFECAADVLPILESSGRPPFSPFANVASGVSSAFGFSACWPTLSLLANSHIFWIARLAVAN